MISYMTLTSISNQVDEEDKDGSDVPLISMALACPMLLDTPGFPETDHQPGLAALKTLPAA